MKDFTKRFKRSPADCTGIDIGLNETAVVRLRRTGATINAAGATVLPPAEDKRISLPARLRARYAAITTPGHGAIAKLLTFPGAINTSFEKQLPKNLGLAENADFRVAYRTISEGTGRTESRVLAVALPEEEAAAIMQFFSSGRPAPYSLELSSLATLTAFQYGPVAAASGHGIGLLFFDTNVTTLSLFHRNTLVLMRRFDFGTAVVLDRVKSTLHVDTNTARGILADAAFDISELLMELMGPIANQLVVSRDFVERREGCRIETLYAIGGIALSRAAMQGLEQTLTLDIAEWDPFDALTVTPQTFSETEDAERWRFAPAIGAALAALEEA